MSNPFVPSKEYPPITYGVDPRSYHALGKADRGSKEVVMSRTELRKFGHCPHRWLLGTPDERSDALDWGELIDCMVLTPDAFDNRYAVCPKTYESFGKTKGAPVEQKPWNWNAGFCKQWREERHAEGLQVVKADWVSEGWKAANRLREDEVLDAFLAVCETQVQVCVDYDDPITGIIVPVKCLIDCVPPTVRDRVSAAQFSHWLGDLKTCENASPRKWARHVFDFGYHEQAALYLDAFNAATGSQRHTFVHLIQESFPPYETGRRMLSVEYLEAGRLAYQKHLRDYCQCLASGMWPSYDDVESSDGELIDGWRITQPESWMVTQA